MGSSRAERLVEVPRGRWSATSYMWGIPFPANSARHRRAMSASAKTADPLSVRVLTILKSGQTLPALFGEMRIASTYGLRFFWVVFTAIVMRCQGGFHGSRNDISQYVVVTY